MNGFKNGDRVVRVDGKPFKSTGKLVHTVDTTGAILFNKVFFKETSSWMWAGELALFTEPPKVVEAYKGEDGRLYPTKEEVDKANVQFKMDKITEEIGELFPRFLSYHFYARHVMVEILQRWPQVKAILQKHGVY